MASANLIQAREAVEAKRKELGDIFAAAQTPDGYDFTKVKGMNLEGDQTARVEAVRKLNAELDDLATKAEGLAELEGIADRTKAGNGGVQHPTPGGNPDAGAGITFGGKSIGEVIAESQAIKGWNPGSTQGPAAEIDLGARPDVAVKTLMTTAAGFAPETVRTGRLVESAQRPIQVLDIIPSTTTTQAAVVYMVESTFTNNAAETAEAGTFPEAALALTETSSPVRKIPIFLPVTDEQLEDVPQVQGYINNRLGFMIRQRLDGQVLVGDGLAPNLEGILNRAGIQTQAKGADPNADAIFKALTKVRVTGRATPGAVVMNGLDWQLIRLLRTADGVYIWGNPSEAGPERIWGLPLIQSEALTAGTALVGDFAMHSELAIRRNITVQVSNSHGTFFIEGKQAIRADMRVALQVYRPAAFCKVTGLA